MITRTIFTTTITAELVNVENGNVSTEHVEITVPGAIKNENTAFKALCKEKGIGAYTGIQFSKTGSTYAMTEEEFMQHAKIIKEG